MTDTITSKEALEQALQEDKLDYGRILALAHDLSKEDQDFIRFSVDASHISRLGLELVSKQETAISELVKNAYDADAVTVDVVFKGSDVRGGTLEIIDSGLGMSREQLLNGFMRISTADKVSEPKSPTYGRQRAGRKGIGRFAAQRLGKKLHISTQLEGADHSLQLSIDWKQFSVGLDLHMIASKVIVSPPVPSRGTTIRVEDLRDSWSEAQIRRAYRYVSDLLQPFPLERKKRITSKTELYTSDPGFKASFYKEQDGELITVANDEQNILANAVARIAASVDSKGVAYINLSSDRYKARLDAVPLRFEPKLRPRAGEEIRTYDLLKGIHLTAHYFIQDELPAGTRGMVREVLNRTGGIRVYRNGFRVLPYGESFDDWLSLQRSSALRELLPPHHNTNFLGFVEITDLDGTRFQETASREGLIENEAFAQLQDFAYRSLVAGVIEIARARTKKVFASDDKVEKPEGPKSEPVTVKEKANQVADRLRTMAEEVPVSADTSRPQLETAKVLTELADEIDRIGTSSQEVIEEIGMLRVLASLGLTIGEFTHEVRHALAALGVTIDNVGHGSVDVSVAQQLSEHVMLLRSYMRYFDGAVTQNAHRKLEVHELRDVINEFVEVMRPTLTRQNVKVEVAFKGYDLFTRPMHKSEWASTLLNLLTNSLKAIQRAQVNGRILIASSVADGDLQIDFSDNGDGIPRDNREKIFEAFFTTSSPPSALATHDDQLIGTGLGLKIVKDILEAAGGDVDVVDPPEGFSTCIRLTVPRAREDQIGDDNY
jgi:signal transduction histidine kinase